ncbi:Cupin 2 conserved barrel domain protein [Methylobacterium sp. 4-46]|uniref:cupin domain-containing protein n=2 Tax=Methylobacterium TaxID=407 RepID=UPI000152D80A|nr:Cupin 2 conserved barrel domain protein [Methylobacterium sp. 4-46]
MMMRAQKCPRPSLLALLAAAWAGFAWAGLTLAGLTLAGLAWAGPAWAGACPAGQGRSGAGPGGPGAPVGVTDTVLGALDLAKESGVAVPGRSFRIRRLVVQPGGIVPFHSHENRPALIYVVQGTIVEHASTCAVPIVHRAGDVSRETRDVAHWWKNESSKPVTLISADLFPEKEDPHVM